ncbi:hypothetical protein FFWV33_00300 [Flavobacterium faecale]|uniref:Membrane-binding protein n=1 Tax=Flavobacterium faecale TaxID=1355330 RepID=A0A2S1L8L5_9FLAO|nr:hypothetical protein [Flavobacterium faecale]AWG20067.1 hypothetical protein FFWV33_00300 [Flavobacterium faecale]
MYQIILNLLFFCCSLVLVQSCQQKEVLIVERNPQKTPALYTLATDEEFNFKQDTLYLKNSKYSGKQYMLYPSKDTAFVKSYLFGMLEGVQKQWYPNGRLAEQRLYVSNKKEGKHLGWWSNGSTKYNYEFYNDEYNGTVLEWYETGQLFKKFHYEQGHEEGSERLWYQDGSVRANYVIKKGKKYGLIGIKLCKNPNEKVPKI